MIAPFFAALSPAEKYELSKYRILPVEQKKDYETANYVKNHSYFSFLSTAE